MVAPLKRPLHRLRHTEAIPATLDGMWAHRPFLTHPLMVLPILACDPIGSARPTQDSGAPTVQEALVVSPRTLDFGTISVINDGTARAEFLVTNAGDETIAVHGHDEVISLENDADLVFEVAADPIFELAPGDSQQLSVMFRPDTEGQWAAEIQVNYGVELLRLEGRSTAPVIGLEASRKEATPIGCSQSLDVIVDNMGSEMLEVSAFDLAVGQDYSFDYESDWPLSINPGEQRVVPVQFSPLWISTAEDEREDTLSVLSNDPLFPSTTLVFENVAYWGSVPDEGFVYAPGMEMDLLFVVDTDGVMNIYNERAETGLAPFVESLFQANVDVHTAIVSHASSCPTTQYSWLSSDDGAPEILDLLEDGFDAPGGFGSSALAEHAATALQNDVPGGCLDGFLRDNAELHVVLVAGEPNGSSQPIEQQLAAIWGAAPNSSTRISVLVPTSSEACSGVTLGQDILNWPLIVMEPSKICVMKTGLMPSLRL